MPMLLNTKHMLQHGLHCRVNYVYITHESRRVIISWLWKTGFRSTVVYRFLAHQSITVGHAWVGVGYMGRQLTPDTATERLATKADHEIIIRIRIPLLQSINNYSATISDL